MIKPLLTLLLTVGMFIPGQVEAQAQALKTHALKVKAKGTKTITLDDKVGKNQFQWFSTAPLENINGTAEGVKGTLTLDPQDLTSIKANISVEVGTFKSGNETRDEHIKAATWLNAAKHPRIEFTLDNVTALKTEGAKASGIANGKFTMHGVTKPIALPFTLDYLDASGKTAKRAAGDLVMITADINVSLKDFNVEGSNGTIGNKVGETIKISAKLFGASK
ncbi:MAG TPA: YceI family protein [Candidatus Kapabacteria bacterium]|jgi:polyisoprenoid-binding protein YceI|nr:YceI family protein [Candidatus Kapabacteria bacterium]